MYISIYSKNKVNNSREHLTNIVNASYTLNRRVFDYNTLSAEGSTEVDCTKGLIYIICDDKGKSLYSGFIKNVKRDNNSLTVTLKGDDFRRIFDTEILLDFSQDTIQDLTLKGIFSKVSDLVTNSEDNATQAIPIEIIVPEDSTDTRFIGDYTGQYLIKNAYSFLKVYLAYFDYYLDSYYDVVKDKIVFTFKKSSGELDIKLKDFLNERTSSDISINKAVATIQVSTEESPRQTNVPTKYYYLGNDNNIYEGLPEEYLRMYPVRAKIFENEYLSQAQFDAISELVNNRYVENILLTSDTVYNPVDLETLDLYTKVHVYTEQGFYRTLPVSEKEIVFTLKEKKSILKLGFKKTLFTEIYKGGR